MVVNVCYYQLIVAGLMEDDMESMTDHFKFLFLHPSIIIVIFLSWCTPFSRAQSSHKKAWDFQFAFYRLHNVGVGFSDSWVNLGHLS